MITGEQIKAAMQAYNEHIDGDVGLEETFRAVLEVYEASKWICVRDRLPERNVIVRVVVDSNTFNGMYKAHDRYGTFFDVVLDTAIVTVSTVTHWQPLPQFKE